MIRHSPNPDPFVIDLHGRVSQLEGLAAGLAAHCAGRVLILRALRERLEEGTIERGLADLLYTLERDASARLDADTLNPVQRGGYRSFSAAMTRLTSRFG